MKKQLLALPLLICSQAVFAKQPTVPDVASGSSAGSSDPIPLFSKEMPLSERDRAALKYANQWLGAARYPSRDGDRVVYLYGAGQPTLVCAPLELCVIYLESGEQVVENGVHLGDTVRWQIAPAVGADHRTQLVVKPVDVGLETSLVVITNRRTYHIRLVSRRKDYMPGIEFKYPGNIASEWNLYQQQVQQEKAHNSTAEGVNLADLDFNYQISNCSGCDFKPTRVYNDGAQTVIEMPKHINRGSAPALLVSGAQGEELVNYRVQNGKYIVDRLFKRAILINGVGRQQQKVTIEWKGVSK